MSARVPFNARTLSRAVAPVCLGKRCEQAPVYDAARQDCGAQRVGWACSLPSCACAMASVPWDRGTPSLEFISIKSLAATGEDEPGIMQGTADVPHPIAAAPFHRRLRSLTL